MLVNLGPVMLAEKMLQHPQLWGIVGVPLGGVAVDNVAECCVNPRWASRLLAVPVVALKRGIVIVTQKYLPLDNK